MHNVYEFDDGMGSKQVYVAVLGNPWGGQSGSQVPHPITGDGLVRFDREHMIFVANTTDRQHNVRSATREVGGVVYAITQEAQVGSPPTKLLTLVLQRGRFVTRGEDLLPARTGGDGGADVFLGLTPGVVFATDRRDGDDVLYIYSTTEHGPLGSQTSLNASDAGGMQLAAQKTLSAHARYTVVLANGDLVVCDETQGSLLWFNGLGSYPAHADALGSTVQISMASSSFFIESDQMPHHSHTASGMRWLLK